MPDSPYEGEKNQLPRKKKGEKGVGCGKKGVGSNLCRSKNWTWSQDNYSFVILHINLWKKSTIAEIFAGVIKVLGTKPSLGRNTETTSFDFPQINLPC